MAPNIKPKKAPVIKAGQNYSYNPTTFAEHKVLNFIEIDDPDELLRLIKPLEYLGRKFIFYDSETHPYFRVSHDVPKGVVRRWVGSGKQAKPQDFPFCMSFCDGKNAYSIYDTIDNGFAKFKKLAPLFEDPTIEFVMHNAKFDMHMLANIGMRIIGKIHDTVVLSKLANENRHSFKLIDLAARTRGGIVKFEYMVDNYKKTSHVTDYRMIPRELMTQYACADVWNAFVVFMKEYLVLLSDELLNLYENELELMIALYAMERHGMKTDPDYETPLKDELQKLTDDAERAIYDEVGYMFNINSGKQLYQALLSCGVSKNLIAISGKGNPVLDKEALNKLAEVHEVGIVKKILEFRKFEKLLGTYAVGIYEQRDAEGRVHGSINQTEATTGRMSITKPALQTLPKKDKRIRRAFIPGVGYALYFLDLDQVEYRFLAHYAMAKGLIEAIKQGFDIHSSTAVLIFKIPIDDISEEQRGKGKTMNFAIVYGQGDEATAVSLKMPLAQARDFKALYFASIPEILPFVRTVHQVVRLRGYIKNYYGRRRRLTSDEAYKAPNALLQGVAADYIKHQSVKMFKYIMYHDLKTRMINIVHDENVLEVHESETHLVPEFRWLMSDFDSFRVPITAGVEYGEPSWGQKKEPEDMGFREPDDKGYLSYNVFNGKVFDIGKEVA